MKNYFLVDINKERLQEAGVVFVDMNIDDVVGVVVDNDNISRALEVLENLKRQMTEEALKRCKGNRTKAAQLLGITRQGLSKRLRAYREVEGQESYFR